MTGSRVGGGELAADQRQEAALYSARYGRAAAVSMAALQGAGLALSTG